MEHGAIELNAHKDYFRLSRTAQDGTVEEMKLSDEDVLQVAASSLHLQSMILARRAKASPNDLVVMPVNQIGIGINPDKGTVNLKMIDPNGFSVAFAVPVAVIKLFQRGLDNRVAELEEKMRIK